MATALNEELLAIQEEAAKFAKERLAVRPELGTSSEFPWDLWGDMAEAGWLGLTVPRDFGGKGGGYPALAAAGEALVRHGHNLGLVLSWLLHNLVGGHLLLGFGNDEQLKLYLPRLAQGQMTGCLAISEPETGAHPKYMRTTAAVEGTSFRLNGRKSYLTNGPIADLFVVMAVTKEAGGRKEITAFLTPRNSPGVSLTEPMKLDCLKPSPHGGLILEDVLVPAENILGRPGQAYEKIIKGFRGLEDAMMMGPLAGGLGRQIELLTGLIAEREVSSTGELKEALGGLRFIQDALRILAYEAAAMIESRASHPELESLLLAGRRLFGLFQENFQKIMDQFGLQTKPELEVLRKDLVFAAGIGRNVSRQKQIKLGEEVLAAGP